MFLVALFVSSVCLSVSNITQNVMNELAMKCYGGARGGKRKQVIKFWW